jgi:hypothetical protein
MPVVMAFLAAGALLGACSHPHDGGAAGPALKSSQMVINGVGQGMSEAEVRAVLGPPSSTVIPFYAFVTEDSLVIWRYPGLRVEFVDQIVSRMTCTGGPARCRTADGVGIGDSRSRVTSVYGPPQELARPLGGLLVYHHPDVPCSLVFRLRHGLVTRIEVSCEPD